MLVFNRLFKLLAYAIILVSFCVMIEARAETAPEERIEDMVSHPIICRSALFAGRF